MGRGDMPFREALGPECSLDWLNGISFKKGCYVGQELIARTASRGVVRKRLTPLVLAASADSPSLMTMATDRAAQVAPPPPGTKIVTLAGKSAGEMGSSCANRGIALLRTSDAFSGDAGAAVVLRSVTEPPVFMRAYKPSWWPVASSPTAPTNG
eukprot:Amastigsp_a348265_4.p2 type:complete len:154 gc:universal Amastigsp_a348265_4:676-215(-)